MILSLIAMVFCSWLAIVALQAPDQRREIVIFAVASAFIGAWTSFPFFMTIITDPQWRLWAARVIYSVAAFVPFFFWYLYFIVMELREKRDTRVLRLALASSIAFSVLAWHSSYLAGVTSSEGLRTVIPGPLYGLFVLYFGVIGFYGSYRMLSQFQHAVGGRRNRFKYFFLGFGIAYCGGLLHFVAAYVGKEPIPHDLLASVSWPFWRTRSLNTRSLRLSWSFAIGWSMPSPAAPPPLRSWRHAILGCTRTRYGRRWSLL
jgi:hypothetical protein